MRDDIRHFFVYGTLKRGEANYIRVLAPLNPVFVTEGSVKAALHSDYLPVMLHNDGAVTHGEVFTFEDGDEQFENTLKYLDGLENFQPQYPQWSTYLREPVWVQTANGYIEAWAYFGNSTRFDAKKLPLLANGVWKFLTKEENLAK